VNAVRVTLLLGIGWYILVLVVIAVRTDITYIISQTRQIVFMKFALYAIGGAPPEAVNPRQHTKK
jgi:hypothetical protein